MVGEPDAGNPHVRFDEGAQETCDSATRLCPTLPQPVVIFRLSVSGYTDDVIAYHGVSDEELNLIQKPFLLDALSARIREVLDQKSSSL